VRPTCDACAAGAKASCSLGPSANSTFSVACEDVLAFAVLRSASSSGL
jgi:hypothetical protein